MARVYQFQRKPTTEVLPLPTLLLTTQEIKRRISLWPSSQSR